MKVLAINGSARRKGNTQILIDTTLAPLREAGHECEVISLAGLNIGGCTACAACKREKDRACHGRSDDLNPLMEKVWEADALIVASPTYFADVTTEVKAFIDRIGYVARANDQLLSRKIGAPLVSARRAGAIHTLDSIVHLFTICDMVTVGSTYWPLAYGGLPGEVAHDEEGLRTATHLGENIAWLLEKIAG